MLLSQTLIRGVQSMTLPDSNSSSRPALDSELLKDAFHVLFHSTETHTQDGRNLGVGLTQATHASTSASRVVRP